MERRLSTGWLRDLVFASTPIHDAPVRLKAQKNQQTISAAVKPEELGQEEDENMLEENGEDEVQEFGSDAELHELGHFGCAIRREGNMHEDGESDTRELVGRDCMRQADI